MCFVLFCAYLMKSFKLQSSMPRKKTFPSPQQKFTTSLGLLLLLLFLAFITLFYSCFSWLWIWLLFIYLCCLLGGDGWRWCACFVMVIIHGIFHVFLYWVLLGLHCPSLLAIVAPFVSLFVAFTMSFKVRWLFSLKVY